MLCLLSMQVVGALLELLKLWALLLLLQSLPPARQARAGMGRACLCVL